MVQKGGIKMRKIIKYSFATLAVFSLVGLTACGKHSTSPNNNTKEKVTITYVRAVTANDLAGKKIQINSGTNHIDLDFGSAGVSMSQKFESSVMPVKIEIKDGKGVVIGSTTDIKSVGGQVYIATYMIPSAGQDAFINTLNKPGLMFFPQTTAGAKIAGRTHLARLATELDVSSRVIKVAFVSAGIVKEVTITVTSAHGGRIDAADLNAALAANGIDISAVTKVEYQAEAGANSADKEAGLAEITAAINELAAASGVEPPSVSLAQVPSGASD